MVSDIARHRAAIDASGTQVAFVHMHPEALAQRYFAPFGLADALRASDPRRHLYSAFDLSRVGPAHWLSWAILRRYLAAIFSGGHRPGYVGGDVLQMAGVFLLRDGKIANVFRPVTVAERFDVLAFLECSDQHGRPA
jgi:hypothetical protein